MSYQGWYTKQDVITDLALASGKYVRDFEESHALVGEQPTPLHPACDEETELQLLRLYRGHNPYGPGEICKPDLAGITQMLRMVDRLTEQPEEREKENISNEGDFLRISKLNPNVQEFIPKSYMPSDKDSKTDKADDCDIVSTLSDSRVDKSLLTPDQLKDMRAKLKTKISDTSKTTCVKVKRERNLAIATLLNLYCKSPKIQSPVDLKPKLIAPDYFKKTVQKCSDDKSESSPTMKADLESIDYTHEKSIAAAVDKVQKWLHASENAKDNAEPPIDNTTHVSNSAQSVESFGNSQRGTPLYLGTVTFKRKATSKPMSPTSNGSVDRVKTQKSTVFVPSSYASELTKTYMERVKIREAIEHDIWTKLEIELKAKDEEIKKLRQSHVNEQHAQIDDQCDQTDDLLSDVTSERSSPPSGK